MNIGTLKLVAGGGAMPWTDYLIVLTVTGNTLAGNLLNSGSTTPSRLTTVSLGVPGGNDAALTVTGSFVQTSGSTQLVGTLVVGSGLLDLQGGAFTGYGIINASVRNAATLSVYAHVGATLSALEVGGSYTQTTSATLVVSLAAASAYSELIVGGTATLAGTLSIVDINGFMPQSGESFNVLSAGSVHGVFANPNPAFTFRYSATGLTLVKK